MVDVLRSHKEVAVNINGLGRGPQLCLVMPAAERSLHHIISAERTAGWPVVRTLFALRLDQKQGSHTHTTTQDEIVYFANNIGRALW